MDNQPDTAWVEAAREAADRVFSAIESINDADLDLKLTSLETVKGTNSADSSFLDYLSRGEHLKGSFLANAR